MRRYFTIIFLLALLVVAIVLSTVSFLREWIDANKSIILVISIVSFIGLIFSLSTTIYQYEKAQENDKNKRLEERKARIDALKSEIDVNLQMEPIISQKASGGEISIRRFYFPIIERALSDGLLTDDEERKLAWSSYHEMASTNRHLEEAKEVNLSYNSIGMNEMVLLTEKANKEQIKYAEAILRHSITAKEDLSNLRDLLGV